MCVCVCVCVGTGGVLRADEDVGGLGQPLHELGDALRVVLGLTQRAHHGAQDAADDAREQLRVEGLGPRGGGGPAGGRSRSGARGRRREDGLGLEMKRWRKDVLMLLYTGNSLSACPLVDG